MTWIDIVKLVFQVIVAGFILFPIIKYMIKTKGKFIEFVTVIFNAVSRAEGAFDIGETKLTYVKKHVLEWCETNGLSISESEVSRLIEVAVAIANLIVKFILKKKD